ncbi:pathogenesis-related leaf protein 4-like [Prosopis cineraria]|uniref:pathogenesis-related leaf protein 4-like n=1 Tax=Prosopis cineraria TaxID=364024 RepID=UPI00240FDE11|nr:pathogenesis-related leaf protein 4-like [Prosopis cineraria]
MGSSNLNLLAIFFIIIFSTLVYYYPICQAQNTPQDFLQVHNEARDEVGVGPLYWNETLESYAQNYANERSYDCNLEHSGGPFGENIAEGYDDMKGSDAVKFWLTEKPNYDYHSNSCVNDECLHYTQIIWRDSHHLGCARAKCANGWMFVICSYDPPGNIEGERPY